MTTLDSRPAAAPPLAVRPTSPTLVQLLASAYAERLSCLRCDATAVELAENAQLIADLERRYLVERQGQQSPHVTVDVRDGESPRTTLRLDPTLYLG
jgi:hypothetical protein